MMDCLPSFWVKMKVLQLVEANDAKQAVSTSQVVVEETKWPPLRKCDEPQGKLRQFNGHWINIDSIDAPLSDESACHTESFLPVLRQQILPRGFLEHYTVR